MSLIQLKTQMQSLCLIGMLEALDSTLALVNQNQLTTVEALDMLLQHERDIRDTKSINYRILRSKIRKGANLEDFDVTHSRKLSPDQIKQLTSLSWCKQGKGLILVGPTGIGKTYLARALGIKACQKGYATTFLSFTEYLENQSLARAQGAFMKFREKLIRPQLLILDDFGMRKLSSLEAEDFRDILEQRSYGKSTAITTQLPFNHWAEVIGDEIILEAIVDRLKGPSWTIHLDGKSYREKLNKN